MLKVSGEALEGKQGFGIDPQVLQVGGAGSLAASLLEIRGVAAARLAQVQYL